MKTQEYKKFKEYVKMADAKDPVWWAGYMWIDLTKRQADDIYQLLKTLPHCKPAQDIHGRPAIEIPSGLIIWENQWN